MAAVTWDQWLLLGLLVLAGILAALAKVVDANHLVTDLTRRDDEDPEGRHRL